MKKVLSVIILFLLLPNAFGQETLPREREREIRTSGRYYYGECWDFDEAVAIDCAISDLTQKVIVDLVRQSLNSNEEILKNAVEIRPTTSILSRTERIRVISWIAKDSVKINVSSTQTPTPPPTDVASQPEISNPIARELATCETFVAFRRMADGLRRQGKLVYGANKTSFVNPDNCFVAVFSREQRLIALLDTGQGARKDLLTGNTIQNVEQHFAGNSLFWIEINN